MFRTVALPTACAGRLYLHSMLGRWEPFEQAREEVLRLNIERVVCLVDIMELREKSPAYADAVEAGDLPWAHVSLPVEDFGVPADRPAFLAQAQGTAAHLRAGSRILVHCAAGVGRTGMFTVCVLRALGMSLQEACTATREAGSNPETFEQQNLMG